MKKRKKSRYGPILTALVIFVSLFFISSTWGTYLYSENALLRVSRKTEEMRIKNSYFLKAALEREDILPVFGSSTITINGPYHPSNYFSSDELKIYLQGGPRKTSLMNMLQLQTANVNLKGKKLVFMLDPSDFLSREGLGESVFEQYYAPLNGYRFALDNSWDPVIKQQIVDRLLAFKEVKNDTLLVSMLNPNHNINGLDKLKAYGKISILEEQDMLSSWWYLLVSPSNTRHAIHKGTWEENKKAATLLSQKQSDGNEFGINNEYFEKNLKQSHRQKKNSWDREYFLDTPEYRDMRFFLEYLKKEEAKPLFILLPKKGKYSDYLGFGLDKRKQLYTKMKETVTEYGYPVLDYTSYEYEPFFMRDPTHIGNPGWVKLCQDLLTFKNSDE